METLRLYKGNCHCGANCFEVFLPEISSAVECNCSVCTKKGYLWAFTTANELEIIKGGGADTMAMYASMAVGHKFCRFCSNGLFGIHTEGPLAGKLAINVRTLWHIDPFKISIEKSDCGIPHPNPRSFHGPEPTVQGGGMKTYTGSCDCGAVRIALKTVPLPQAELRQDNCSGCARNGGINIYPTKAQVSIVGSENTGDFAGPDGRKFGGTGFCKTCGVSVYVKLYGPPPEEVARASEARKKFIAEKMNIQPVNVRVLDGVEWDEITVSREDVGTEGYVVPD